MNIESLIKDNINKISNSATLCRVYCTPDIPEKKLNNALSSIAEGVGPDYVLAVVDTTLFGSAKEGMVWIGDRVLIKNNGQQELLFKKIKNIEKKTCIEENDNGEKKTISNYYIDYDGDILDITRNIEYTYADGFVEIIKLIINAISVSDSEIELESTNQTCPLAMMDSDIKEAYLKLICNFGYSDDGLIDSSEYAEIMSLIAINSVEKNIRISIRSYMYDNNNVDTTESLVKYLEERVDAGSLEALKISVVKDIINMYWSKLTDKQNIVEWKSNKFIEKLVNLLKISDEQVDYVVENIKRNKEIIANRQDDSQIKQNMQELLAKASAVGVPMAAIYFSGSVIGVSAAGMTSGLAALGMGGVLGFSSMVTGIGVAILLGVGAYKGVKKVTGMGELEKNKQREKMLQEIIKNSQVALNYLIEDVNEISFRLQEVIENDKENNIKIQKLAGMISMLSRGAQKTSDQIDFAEKEKIICNLPEVINPNVIMEMAPGATKQPIRELIFNAYCEEKTDDEGNMVNNCLNTNLSSEELSRVYESLQAIGYYSISDNTKAHAKNMAKGIMKGILG